MFTLDTCCTLVPYFEVQEDKLADFKALGPKFVAKTHTEPGCRHYAFSYNGNAAHCREGYDNAEAILAHLKNVGDLLGEALKIAKIVRLEVHAPASEIEKLRAPLASLKPTFFALSEGIRRKRPNPSIERTRTSRPRYTCSSFYVPRGLLVRAAHVKR